MSPIDAAFTRIGELFRELVALIKPALAKLQEILDRHRYGYRCQDCGRWFTESHRCGDKGQHIHSWIDLPMAARPIHTRVTPPVVWKFEGEDELAKRRAVHVQASAGTHLGRDVPILRPQLDPEARAKLIDAFRRHGWVIWDPPPPGHVWRLVNGRYQAVPIEDDHASGS